MSHCFGLAWLTAAQLNQLSSFELIHWQHYWMSWWCCVGVEWGNELIGDLKSTIM
jgi:hypothetical protein